MKFPLLLLAGFVSLFIDFAFAQAPPPPPVTAPTMPQTPSSVPPPAPVGSAPQGITAWQPLPSLQQLQAQLEALEKQFADGEIPRDAQNLALLRLKLEQGRLYLERLQENNWLGWPDEARRRMATTLDRADEVGRATGDAASTPLQMHERAYIAKADDSSQPYWVFLPKDYSPDRQYPLVIFLHGYDPGITKIEPWLPDEETWGIVTERNFIFAVPYGRRNSDFVNIGEDDTVAVADEVQKHYSVDTQRVFLLGPSMGGFGAYVVGLHQPHRWAGASVMCARTDFYLWFNLNREQLPPWKRILYDADDPRHLAHNAHNLPLHIQHGALDTIVPVEHSRRFVADLQRLNHAVTYQENPDGDHYIYWNAFAYEEALDWMSRQRPLSPPRRVSYTTGSLRDNRAHWATLNAFERYDQTAEIIAEIQTQNLIEVKTKNVAAFTLNPPTSWLEAERPVTLKVNGQDAGTFAAGEPVEYFGSRPKTDAPVKTPQRSGPIKNIYRDPFLLVYGTQAGPDDEAKARRFAQEWYLFADGKPPIKADKDVTDEDYARYNLILFGTRQSNSLLRQIADTLPLELTPDGYRLGETQVRLPQSTLGMQLCYPSPWNAERMIVVQSGHFWGEALPINHKFDLLPEYIVYSDQIDFSDSTNRALTAGFFDHEWKLPSVTAPQR